MNKIQDHASFRVGDRVKFAFGRGKVTGVIVEDRGPLGVRGRRLFQVEIPMDPFEPMTMELAEDEMEPVSPGEEVVVPLDREKVKEYLRHGGLMSILWANRSDVKHQPRAWLCRNTLGNVTHTFVPDRGLIGGEVVPFRAVWDGKIAADKRDAVVSFLESFGLNCQETEEVVSEVGTAP